MSSIDELIKRLREINDAGTRQLANGAWLIGKLPPRRDGRFAEAYLHEIYAGLTGGELGELEDLVEQKLPEQLRTFYRQANGLSLFCDSISIRGLRRDYSRDGLARQPVSLEYGNTIERPVDEGLGYEKRSNRLKQIRFGYFAAAEAELVAYIEGQTTIEALPAMQLGPVLHTWPDLATMLRTEVERMAALYKNRRGDVDPLSPLEPPWSSKR